MPSPNRETVTAGWHEAALAADEALNRGHAAALSTLRELEASERAWPASASMLVLRNFTVEPLDQYVKLAAFRRGIDLRVDVAGYDTGELAIHDPSSALRTGGYDVVVFAAWLDEIRQAFDSDGSFDVDAASSQLADLASGLLRASSSIVVLNTMIPDLGAVDATADDIALLNQRVHDLAREDSRLFVTDVHHLTLELGRKAAVDTRFQLSARAPLRPPLHRLWAIDLAQVVASICGRTRKVLAIDCDGTLWGGILGEDGIEGIALSPNEPEGRLYHTIQSQLIRLHRRGVLLALCSRNNEADVLAVLEEHPHCLIKQEMLAGRQINWQDKASNVQALARQMNLGLDTFVFLDDSPVECERVRRALPEVDVLQLGTEPAKAVETLARYDGWSRLAVTSDDVKRTARYRAEQARAQVRESAESFESFLASLDLGVSFEIVNGNPTDEVVGRLAQLTQRTNQFNATTRRYGPGEIAALCADPQALVIKLTVRDRFGDYGTTGLAIVLREGYSARLDTFLLSCRVLGRGVEDAFLTGIVHVALDAWSEVEEIAVEYRRSPKNAVVHRFLQTVDLRHASADADTGEETYVADRIRPIPDFPGHVTVTTPVPFTRLRASSTT